MTLTGLVKDGMLRLVLDPANEEPGWTEVPLPAGVPPEYLLWDGAQIVVELATARATKQAAISSRFVQATLAGCASPKGWVDCDEVAQGRVDRLVKLIEKAAELGMPTPETVDFTMFDKSQVAHSPAELVTLGITIGFHFLSLFGVKQALEAALAAAVTLEAIQTLDIEDGWPS